MLLKTLFLHVGVCMEIMGGSGGKEYKVTINSYLGYTKKSCI